MSKFGVTTQKEAALRERMAACGLVESDIEEQFIRAGGPGRPHVNRSATCVYVKHVPTGLEVKMQESRSQGLNRFKARRRLCELIEARRGEDETPEARARERSRKRKAQRRRRARKKYEGSGEDAGREGE